MGKERHGKGWLDTPEDPGLTFERRFKEFLQV